MTIQISIIKESQVTNQATFPTMEEAQAWLERHEGMKTFGEPAHTVQQQVEIFPAVVDEEGTEISPAQFEMQDFQIPATYQVEIVDISAQLEQESINAAALKMLAESDWMVTRLAETGVAIPEEVSLARAAARASIVR
jgi:hypothetical protein